MDDEQNYQEQMENAAEAAKKRRDLRRRRILADPEQRMRRIVGYNESNTGKYDNKFRVGDNM